MSNLWGREPVMILALVQAGLAMGMGFGLHITSQQMALILTFTGVLIGVITRTQVVTLQNHVDAVNAVEAKK